MFLKKVEGSYFRNYQEFSLDISSHFNLFTGDNGQGKTSFLEAIFCALRGHSFQPFISDQIIKNKEKVSKIRLTFEEEQGDSFIEALFTKEEARMKKEFFYCGKKTSLSFLRKQIKIIVFTEESVRCIRLGSDHRRTFIDEIISLGEKKQKVTNFKKILKEKRTLLKNRKQGLISFSQGKEMLEWINKRFLDLSSDLLWERLQVLETLFSPLESLSKGFFGELSPKLSFKQNFSENTKIKKEDIFQKLKKDLQDQSDREIQIGLPLIGPQKQEIFFLFNGQDSRVFCSKGQQRAFILSLLGSYIIQNPKSLLLMDDILLELDEKTQKQFLQFLEKQESQLFLTSCQRPRYSLKNQSVFLIKKARIKRLPNKPIDNLLSPKEQGVL